MQLVTILYNTNYEIIYFIMCCILLLCFDKSEIITSSFLFFSSKIFLKKCNVTLSGSRVPIYKIGKRRVYPLFYEKTIGAQWNVYEMGLFLNISLFNTQNLVILFY